MPKGRYTIGARGTRGCSGYPVVSESGRVLGCHKTRASARAQQAAIYVSEAAKLNDEYYPEDSAIRKSATMAIINELPEHPDLDDEAISKAENGEDPCWEGYEMVGWKNKNGKRVPNCVPRNRTKKSADDRFEIVESHPKCEGVALVEVNGTSVICYPNREAAQAALDDMDREEPDASVRPDESEGKFWTGVFK